MTLKNYISVYVPSNVKGKVNRKLQRELIGEILREFSAQFGGASSFDIDGAWINPKRKNLVREKIVVCKAYSERSSRSLIPLGKEIARDIKTRAKQDAVMFEVNNAAYFV